MLARVTSYDWLLSLAAMPLGYAVAPLAAHAFGAAAPLYVSAAAGRRGLPGDGRGARACATRCRPVRAARPAAAA